MSDNEKMLQTLRSARDLGVRHLEVTAAGYVADFFEPSPPAPSPPPPLTPEEQRRAERDLDLASAEGA